MSSNERKLLRFIARQTISQSLTDYTRQRFDNETHEMRISLSAHTLKQQLAEITDDTDKLVCSYYDVIVDLLEHELYEMYKPIDVHTCEDKNV